MAPEMNTRCGKFKSKNAEKTRNKRTAKNAKPGSTTRGYQQQHAGTSCSRIQANISWIPLWTDGRWRAYLCSGSAGASVVAHSVALPLIEIAFSTLDCSIVPTCGAWCSATAAKRGPLKQSWAEIQHSRDDEPLGVLMQMRSVRVNGFLFFSCLGVLPGVLVDTLSLCSGNFCVECVLIVLHTFYIEL